MRVRIVLPIAPGDEHRDDRIAFARRLEELLAPTIAGVKVTQRNDQGIVIVANFYAVELGALEAGAGVLELVHQALARTAPPRLAEYLNTIAHANITVRGG